jgi:hypothetical protein
MEIQKRDQVFDRELDRTTEDPLPGEFSFGVNLRPAIRIDREGFAERKGICAVYLPQIARGFVEQRKGLVVEWAEKLYDSFAARRVGLPKSLDDIPRLLIDLRLHFCGTVIPLLACGELLVSEREAIRLAIDGRESYWIAMAVLISPADVAEQNCGQVVSLETMTASLRVGLADDSSGLGKARATEVGAEQTSRIAESFGRTTADAHSMKPKVIAFAHPATVTKRGTRGPKRDFSTALKVDDVVRRLATDGNWREQLENICDSLDEAKVRCPKPWKKKGYGTWYDGMTFARPLVIKAIEHHRDRAQEHRETFS